MQFTQVHLILLKMSFKFIQVYSDLFEIGSIRVKQMTAHLNDWTHSDLYEKRYVFRIQRQNPPNTMIFAGFRVVLRILRTFCTFFAQVLHFFCNVLQKRARLARKRAKFARNRAKLAQKCAKRAQNARKCAKHTQKSRFLADLHAGFRRRTNFHTTHLCAPL